MRRAQIKFFALGFNGYFADDDQVGGGRLYVRGAYGRHNGVCARVCAASCVC